MVTLSSDKSGEDQVADFRVVCKNSLTLYSSRQTQRHWRLVSREEMAGWMLWPQVVWYDHCVTVTLSCLFYECAVLGQIGWESVLCCVYWKCWLFNMFIIRWQIIVYMNHWADQDSMLCSYYSSACLSLEAFHVVHVITSVGNLFGTVFVWWFWRDGILVDKTCNYLRQGTDHWPAGDGCFSLECIDIVAGKVWVNYYVNMSMLPMQKVQKSLAPHVKCILTLPNISHFTTRPAMSKWQ